MMSALAMFLGIVFLATWLPAKWRRRAVGMGLASDIAIHAMLQTFFGGDAEGRAAMLVAGLLLNTLMHLYRWVLGYEKPTLKGWVRHHGILS